MRIVGILISLAVGLLGLLMSVCGGGFLITLGYDQLRQLVSAHRGLFALNGIFVLLMPAGFLALGIVTCRSAYQMLRKYISEQ